MHVDAFDLVEEYQTASISVYILPFFFSRRQKVDTLPLTDYSLDKWTVVEEDPEKGQIKG